MTRSIPTSWTAICHSLDRATGTPIDIGVGIPFPASSCTPVTGVTFPGNNVYVPSAACNIGLFSFNRAPARCAPTFRPRSCRCSPTTSGSWTLPPLAPIVPGNSDFSNYQEFANGFGASSGHVSSLITGSSETDRVSGNADFGLTYHFTPNVSFSDKFRWLDWRDPGSSNQPGFTCTATPAPGLTPGTAGCTTPNAGNTNLYQTLIAERTFYNTGKVEPELGPRQRICWLPLWTAGTDRRPIGRLTHTEQLLPGDQWRGRRPEDHHQDQRIHRPGRNFLPPDHQVADQCRRGIAHAPTTPSPILGRIRQQRVRANAAYKVNRWASINGGVHFVETSNNLSKISMRSTNPANPNLFPTTAGVPAAYGHQDHWRYYTFGGSLHPDRYLGFDFGWTYLDQLINSATCVPSTGPTLQPIPASVTANPPGNAGGIPLILDYQERTNSGYAILTVQPIHRVTLNAGYEITSTAGYNRWLLPGGPDGTGLLLVISDIYGNSPPLAGNPLLLVPRHPPRSPEAAPSLVRSPTRLCPRP